MISGRVIAGVPKEDLAASRAVWGRAFKTALGGKTAAEATPDEREHAADVATLEVRRRFPGLFKAEPNPQRTFKL